MMNNWPSAVEAAERVGEGAGWPAGSSFTTFRLSFNISDKLVSVLLRLYQPSPVTLQWTRSHLFMMYLDIIELVLLQEYLTLKLITVPYLRIYAGTVSFSDKHNGKYRSRYRRSPKQVLSDDRFRSNFPQILLFCNCVINPVSQNIPFVFTPPPNDQRCMV